jgi:nickel-dependent lactate racemase
MRIVMEVGRQRLDFEAAPSNCIASRPPPAALPRPAEAVRAALEAPFAFPQLRRALTPDDHLAVVVDEDLPDLARLLVPLLEHLVSAGVSPEAVTLVSTPSPASHSWIDNLPDEFEEVRVEVHDPADRRRLAYLATTAAGKRLYLNRTVVEADQVLVLSGRRYDTLLGYGGAEGSLYPALADEPTRAELGAQVNLGIPGEGAWPAHKAAVEVTWLLGQPFFVQCIAGAAEGIAAVVAGTTEASREGERILDACWRQGVAQRADLVVVSLAGEPARHTFAEMASALHCATRVVRPGGRIVLLSTASPPLGAGSDVLRQHDDPRDALAALLRQASPDLVPAILWANSAAHANLNAMSRLPDETVEELFATPVSSPAQVQRLIDAGGSCLFLEDAHRMLVTA